MNKDLDIRILDEILYFSRNISFFYYIILHKWD